MGKPKEVIGTSYLITDATTGEVVNQADEGDTITITRAESLNKLRETLEWKCGDFFKGYIPELRAVLKELPISEKALLISIGTYVSPVDCCLKRDDGEPVSFEDLVELSGMSRGTVHAALSGLLKEDIIFQGKNSHERQYFVNPWLFCKGNRINKVLQTMFRNYRVKVLGGQRWGNIKETPGGYRAAWGR